MSETDVAEVEAAPVEVAPTPVVKQAPPKTTAEQNAERQGKRNENTKKKVGNFNEKEAKAELSRLERGGQTGSVYYAHVVSRAKTLNIV